jgi:O-antigen/teichoic acid export membrane protein
VVAKLLGAEALGYYGLAWQLSTYLYNIPASAGFVVLPKILRAHGEGGPEATRRSVLEMTRALGLLVPPLAGMAAIAGPAVVRLVLKRYMDAIPPLEILLLATVFLAVPTALRTTFIAQNRERELIGFQALAGLVSAGAVAWLITRDAPLAHLALGAGAGWLVGGATVSWRGLRGLGLTTRGTAAHLLESVVPFAYCASARWGLKLVFARWAGAPSPLVCDAISLVVFAGLCVPLVWYAERTTGILSKFRARGRGPTERSADDGYGGPDQEGGGEI